MDLPISPGLLISLIIVVIGILIISKGLVIVRQSEVMVIERLGSFHRVLESGINIIIPFIEQPRAITMIRYKKMGEEYHPITSDEIRIDRRETVMDFPGQPVVTTDNVTVRINGALYYQIIDPKRAVYEVENMSQAVEVLAKTTLRSVVGKMELDKLFESRAEVNNEIQAAMEEPASKWGSRSPGSKFRTSPCRKRWSRPCVCKWLPSVNVVQRSPKPRAKNQPPLPWPGASVSQPS